jgi:hypothetical protein
MAELIPAEEQANYETFRDCLSEPVIKALAAPVEKSKTRKKRHAKKNSKERNGVNEKKRAGLETPTTDLPASDAEDLGEFIEVTSSPTL